MADASTGFLAYPRPLTSSDAAGLLADTMPRQLWEPAQLLETQWEVGTAGASVPGPIGAANDIWLVRIQPPSAMPGYVFYPICLRACLINDALDAGFAGPLFNSLAAYTLDPPRQRHWVWQRFTGSTPRTGYDGAGQYYFQDYAPTFRGYPPRPMSLSSSSVSANALAGFQFAVQVWNAPAAANTELHIEARFLAFPQSALRSAGFYVPRLYFSCN
jgi:hypothetical protein